MKVLKYLIRQFNIRYFIALSCIVIYFYSHLLLLTETKQLNKKLIQEETNIKNEWKTKFIKEQIRINGNVISKEKGEIWGFAVGLITGASILRKRKQDE